MTHMEFLGRETRGIVAGRSLRGSRDRRFRPRHVAFLVGTQRDTRVLERSRMKGGTRWDVEQSDLGPRSDPMIATGSGCGSDLEGSAARIPAAP